MRSTHSRPKMPYGSFCPRLEALEDRLCLSVTVGTVAVFDGNLLKITGDSAADTVFINDSGNGQVEVTDADGNVLGTADDVRAIRVDLKGGNDVVNYTLTDVLTNSQRVSINLGSGDANQATIDLGAGVSDANLLLDVQSASGADTLAAEIGSLTAARVGLFLGGGGGADVISLLAEDITVDEDSLLCIGIDGGAGDDSITTTLSGTILGAVGYSVDGNRGADTIEANLTAAPGSTGYLFAAARGGAGTDSVTLNVNDNSGDGGDGTLAKLHAAVFDFDEADTLAHTDNVEVITTRPRWRPGRHR